MKKEFKWTDETVAELLSNFKMGHTGAAQVMENFKEKYIKRIDSSTDKYPEGIVAFKNDFCTTYVCTSFTKNEYQDWCNRHSNTNTWSINKVKNSKGEEFSIGDNCYYNNHSGCVIKSFEIRNNLIYAIYKYGIEQSVLIDSLKKSAFLFKDELGNDVYEGDYFFYVVEDVFEVLSAFGNGISKVSTVNHKRFKYKRGAENWIEKNKPKFSEQQILDALEYARTNINSFKQKLGIKCT